MKSALTVVLFLLLTIGVFVDGNEESVSVTEGDSVTLKSGVTEIQTDDEIEWWFSGSKLASISRDDSGISVWVKADGSFRDRLQLDNQTGDLKISNIRTTDSGKYKPKISSPRGSPPEIIFTVKVVSADVSAAAVKSVSVLEGYSVTLHTDLTEIHREDVIRWMFEQQKSPVAELNRKAGIFNIYDGADGRFRGRLQLDQAGSLIITDTRTTDSGLYEADISSSRSRHTTHHTQSFNLTVRDAVKSVFLEEGETVTLQITEKESNDQIQWMFGDTVLAEINKTAQQFFTYDGPDERFRGRLNLDHQTGSLTITDTRTTDSGVYKLKISSSRDIINQRFFVLVTDSGWSSGFVAGIGVGGVLLGAAAAGVIYYCYKKSKVIRQNHALNGKQNPDDHVNEGTELTNAS